MQASQVACIVAAVAMNDEFGFGAERQMRIRTRVEELSKEYSEKGMKPLLEKMEKIGFHIQGTAPFTSPMRTEISSLQNEHWRP